MTQQPNYAHVWAGQTVLGKTELSGLMEADAASLDQRTMLNTASLLSDNPDSHLRMVAGQPIFPPRVVVWHK